MITKQCEMITQTYQQYDWKLNFTVNFLETNNKTNPIAGPGRLKRVWALKSKSS